MTLLQLFAFLYGHPELTIGLGVIFVATLWTIESVLAGIITMPLRLAKERTKQLTLQLELGKTRQAKPKPASITEHDYEVGYQQQAMEQS